LRVAALIPAFNEGPTVADVVAGIRSTVALVLVVDDGSSDDTAARARLAGAEVLSLGANMGKGTAIRAGLGRLFADTFTHVLFIDADLQHRPEEAAALVDASERTGADLVVGERQFRREDMPASRYHANRLGSLALSWFVGAPVRDTQCGFRVCRIEPLRGLRLRARGYDIETEMLVKLRRRGARLASVPVSAVYATERSKLRPIRDTTRTCFLAVYYQFFEPL
jgi:glycosyltransferase involved in cell wall biosynthesis